MLIFYNFTHFIQRGDSLDTIFASSPPDSDIRKENRIKTKTKKRTSPRRRRQFEQHQQESTDQEIASYDDSSHMALPRKRPSMIIDNITGNITQMSDSVILDIEPSSNESHTDADDDDLAEASVFEGIHKSFNVQIVKDHLISNLIHCHF